MITDSKHLYVRNLPYSIAAADLETELRAKGWNADVFNINVPGSFRLAFATSQESYAAFQAFKGVEIFGRKLFVRPWMPKKDRDDLKAANPDIQRF